MGEDGGARTSRASVGWGGGGGGGGGGHVGWEEGSRGVAGCLLINSCNFLKPHR